jgi:hypothetical protein
MTWRYSRRGPGSCATNSRSARCRTTVQRHSWRAPEAAGLARCAGIRSGPRRPKSVRDTTRTAHSLSSTLSATVSGTPSGACVVTVRTTDVTCRGSQHRVVGPSLPGGRAASYLLVKGEVLLHGRLIAVFAALCSSVLAGKMRPAPTPVKERKVLRGRLALLTCLAQRLRTAKA